MAAFFAKTWFLWYAFAVMIITRWFHVAAGDIESEFQVPQRNQIADSTFLEPLEVFSGPGAEESERMNLVAR